MQFSSFQICSANHGNNTNQERDGNKLEEYSYRGFARLRVTLLQLGGIISILICTSFAIGIVTLKFMTANNASTETIICLAIWSLLVGWTIGVSLINMHPTIWVETRGVRISAFFLRRIFIPWSEIIDLRAKWTLFGDFVVRTEKITPAHQLVGWIYSRSLHPSFIIGRNIENRDDLFLQFQGHGIRVYE